MIKFLGHASIYLKTDKISIVTDPWFSKTGTYQFSWFQFPDNTDIDFSWVDDLDYVCLSHEHIDHYDVDFLKTLNRKTKIVTANFNNKRFLKSLTDNLDNEIIEVKHKDTFLLGDINKVYSIKKNYVNSFGKSRYIAKSRIRSHSKK